jgi:hypothetical protein
LFDSGGNYLWGDNSSIGYTGIDVEVDDSGNVYMVTLDYASATDIKVIKYSVAGSVLFTYIYDYNSHYESPSRINLQPDGSVVISGVSSSPADSTGIEMFKLSSTGSLMWEAFYHTAFPDIPTLNFMATNPNTGDVFVTGTTSISGNPAHIFTIKYDSAGNQSWAALYDSTATRGMGLAIASDGSVYVVGLNWWTVLRYGQSIVNNVHSFSEVTTQVSLFPNPAIDFLKIELASYCKKVEITITNITGKIIYSTTAMDTQKLEVNTKDFEEGVYMVQIQTPDFIKTKKLIVTK